MLGTGSNIDIGDDLFIWHKKYVKKQVYHLPTYMPHKPVSIIKVLWQLAIEQAKNKMLEVTKDLDSLAEQFYQKNTIPKNIITDSNFQSS